MNEVELAYRLLPEDVKIIAITGTNGKTTTTTLTYEIMKKAFEIAGYSEDELKRYSDEVQKLTDKFIANIDTLAKEKEQAIMAF